MPHTGGSAITDLSGSAEYLTSPQREPAHKILKSLFGAQLRAIKHPFVLAGVRGDAIFVYVPETHFIRAESFLEALAKFYVVFAGRLEQLHHRTPCTLQSCMNLDMWELKQIDDQPEEHRWKSCCASAAFLPYCFSSIC